MNTTNQREVWSQRLTRMRGPGKRRAQKGKASQSLTPLLDRLPKGAIVIDVGCGESGDRNVARKRGFVAFGLDLFVPHSGKNFIQADALSLPFADASVDGIVNHAMVALVSPSDRWTLYQEVARVLKPEGLFSITPYPLSDGFAIRTAVEDGRIFESGLHRIRGGLYTKCSILNCEEHPPLGSWAAIERGVRQIDPTLQFTETAGPFIAWIISGGSFRKAIKFSGANPDRLHSILRGAVDCGIFNAEQGMLDLPWLNDYMNDENLNGDITLVCDVLAIRGEVERSKDENGPTYRALAKCQ